jgi:iron(III) transport system substrate-binding protein
MKKNIFATLMIIVVLLSACSPATEAPAKPTATDVPPEPTAEPTEEATGEKILVYIAGPESMINKLEQAFEEKHGDVLDMTIMGCGPLRAKVWSESQAGEIQADVFWGSNPLLYNLLDENGFLEPLELKEFDNIAPQ